MRTRIFGLTGIAILTAVAAIGFACGGSESPPAASGTPATSTPIATQPDHPSHDSSGAIVPNTFLTYGGKRYRLADMIQANLTDGSAFSAVGKASQADIDGDRTVFNRSADPISVYTFWRGSGSGEAAIPDMWYKWEPAD